jgi:uroporphyrinogen decarboxylase
VTQAVKKNADGQKKPLLAALAGEKAARPPFWFMRQAGRYLPEYRALRKDAGSFLDLCYTPELAAEVTVQPLRRYGMDAAILFSDILVVPHALGQEVAFQEGKGPVLGALDIGVLDVDNLHDKAAPVYETVRKTRRLLREDPALDDQALIGFAGAPWTVATYMVEGGGSKEFMKIREMMYGNPDQLDALIAVLTEATIAYLARQIEAGAEAIQIFDSWAGILPEEMFEKYVIAPTAEIVAVLRQDYPDVPVIGFPKGAGLLYKNYAQQTGVTALGLDYTLPPEWAAQELQSICPVQGCLDPALLLAGGDVMLAAAQRILDVFSGGPFIFNLGHGINKETKPETVAQLSAFLKGST